MKQIYKPMLLWTFLFGVGMGCQTLKNIPVTIHEFFQRLSSNTPSPRALPVDVTFEDLPVPKNFERVDEQSWYYAQNPLKMLQLVYVGENRLDWTVNFYREEMEKKGWTLSQTLGPGRYITLYFIQPHAHSEVKVEYISDHLRLKTRIQIDLTSYRD